MRRPLFSSNGIKLALIACPKVGGWFWGSTEFRDPGMDDPGSLNAAYQAGRCE